MVDLLVVSKVVCQMQDHLLNASHLRISDVSQISSVSSNLVIEVVGC